MTARRRWALLLAVLGAVSVFLATARYGPGLTPDSVHYFSVAASLSSGEGLLTAAGEPFVHFPPAFPAILAVFGLGGLEVHTAARLLNALCLALVVSATVSLAARATANDSVGALAGAFVLFSAPFLDAYTYALSEAPFVALLACFALLIPRFAHDDSDLVLAALVVVAALLALTRYVGIVILPVAAVTVAAMSSGTPLRRCVRAAAFSIVAAMPLLAWLLRNVLIAGTPTAGRGAASALPLSVVRGFVASAADWLVPWEWLMELQSYSDAPWALLLFFAAAIVVAGWVLRQLVLWWPGGAVGDTARADGTAPRTDSAARGIVGFLALWVVVYSTFLCLSAMLVAFNPMGPRFLVPLLFPVVVLVAVALSNAAQGESAGAGSARLRGMLVGIVVAVIALQFARTTSLIVRKRAEGAGGYATVEWQESPLLEFLVTNPPPTGAKTNGADGLFLFLGQRHPWVPGSADIAAIGAFASSLERGDPVSVVWFDAIDWRPYLMSRERLLGLGGLEVTHEVADGALYSSRPR